MYLTTRKRTIHCCTALVAIFLCFFLTACETYMAIVTEVTEAEANQIIVYLAGHGITAQKTAATSGGPAGGGDGPPMWNIQVEKKKITEALSMLSAVGLPKPKERGLLDIFTGSTLVPSEQEQNIRYQAGLGDQISNIINQIDGVLSSHVILSLPSSDSTNRETTASVYVKHQGAIEDPNTHIATKVKRLVSSAVPALDYDDVTVVMDRSSFSDITTSPFESSTLEEAKHYVRIAGIVIGTESISLFRWFFFSVLILFFIALVLLAWIIWKTFPILTSTGGAAALFSLKPLIITSHQKEEKEELQEEIQSDKREKKQGLTPEELALEEEEEEEEEEEGEE
ncbi:EscJ/YscJ/HrcJ family type III secretion inner membrane ring protein [Simkania negevensis]|uniref:EscJ/YscJ/HrcJ family type III secretion inner membrane ring protein n=1 Tax=Simkania negevensis TaxID=83561 RepID=A0ABS3ASS9_9BACT|nr:EscJ/YscJ/HrcJ family type III secretion inner membrane ring protein [Simkania negevensis]